DFGFSTEYGEPFSGGEMMGNRIRIGDYPIDQNVHFKEDYSKGYYTDLFNTWHTILANFSTGQIDWGKKHRWIWYYHSSDQSWNMRRYVTPRNYDFNSFKPQFDDRKLSSIKGNGAFGGYKMFPMSDGVYGSSVLLNAQIQTKLPLASMTTSVCRAYLPDSSLVRWSGDLAAGVAIDIYTERYRPLGMPDGKYTFVSGEVVIVAGGLVESVNKPSGDKMEVAGEKYKCSMMSTSYKLPKPWGELIYPARKLIAYPTTQSYLHVSGYYSHPEIIGNKKIQVPSAPVRLMFRVVPPK
ncbi:MAG: hypothetical protein ACI83I_000165, partial [Bacteroidia bacterium]